MNKAEQAITFGLLTMICTGFAFNRDLNQRLPGSLEINISPVQIRLIQFDFLAIAIIVIIVTYLTYAHALCFTAP